ncbi:MAG: hypothetical protein ACXACO_20750 [Promethearchaeota archaeon]|jgi:t-SNARE complex subunit (syntaxin)
MDPKPNKDLEDRIVENNDLDQRKRNRCLIICVIIIIIMMLPSTLAFLAVF